MRLLLGLPTGGSPSAPFLESLGRLRLPPEITDFERTVVTGNFVPAQRELLFELALANGFDYLAMIDDDIVAPPDALQKLCSALDADPIAGIAGALYYSRDGLRPMAVDAWVGGNTTNALVPAFDDSSAVTVDGVGFGCVVLRTVALRALTAPYLSAHIVIERSARRVRVADEDYLFCERLRGAGMTVRLHGGVRCGHYDRATAKLIPDVWEGPSLTNQRRMYVRTTQGEALIAPDFSLAASPEAHQAVAFDYLRVD